MKRAIARTREAIAARAPASIRQTLGPAGAHLRMLFADHLVIRHVFKNRHELAPGVWRSAQPLPYQIGELRQLGIRTLINLRGPTKTATYALEQAACAEAGIRMIDFAMKSRAAPSAKVLLDLKRLLESVERPFLFHCKSGADRAGFVSAIYLHLFEGMPIAEARNQLALRFGHIRQADTGVLDYFFDRYLEDCLKKPMAFYTWVETLYDPGELNRSFHAKGWATSLVRTVLRRE